MDVNFRYVNIVPLREESFDFEGFEILQNLLK